MRIRPLSYLMLLTGLLFAATLPRTALAQQREQVLDRSFDVRPGDRLDVDVSDADVSVTTGSDDRVHVEIWLEGRDMDRARAYFEDQRFEVSRQGRNVVVRTNRETRLRFSTTWRDQPHIEVAVTAPREFDAMLRTSDGDIRIEQLLGEIDVKTSDGDVSAGILQSSAARLRTSDGDVTIRVVEADEVDVHTSDGDIAIDELTSGSSTVRTSDGDIRIERLTGASRVRTSDGDIVLGDFEGPTLALQTSDGTIDVGTLVAERSTVRSSDGDVAIDRVEGDLDATTSDSDLTVGLSKPGTVRLKSSGGDVVVRAPAALPADLWLRGDDVRVSSAFDFTGSVDDDRAEGRINGGGPVIRATASSGDVVFDAD